MRIGLSIGLHSLLALNIQTVVYLQLVVFLLIEPLIVQCVGFGSTTGIFNVTILLRFLVVPQSLVLQLNDCANYTALHSDFAKAFKIIVLYCIFRPKGQKGIFSK